MPAEPPFPSGAAVGSCSAAVLSARRPVSPHTVSSPPRLRGGLRPPWPRAWAAAGMPLLAFRFYSRLFNVHRHVNVLEDHFLSNRGPVFPRRRRDCRSNPPSPDVHRQLTAGRFRFRGSAVFS